jgi:hypothetical protein
MNKRGYAEHVACVGYIRRDMRSMYKLSVKKPEGKPKHKWKDSNKTYLRKRDDELTRNGLIWLSIGTGGVLTDMLTNIGVLIPKMTPVSDLRYE